MNVSHCRPRFPIRPADRVNAVMATSKRDHFAHRPPGTTNFVEHPPQGTGNEQGTAEVPTRNQTRCQASIDKRANSFRQPAAISAELNYLSWRWRNSPLPKIARAQTGSQI